MALRAVPEQAVHLVARIKAEMVGSTMVQLVATSNAPDVGVIGVVIAADAVQGNAMTYPQIAGAKTTGKLGERSLVVALLQTMIRAIQLTH